MFQRCEVRPARIHHNRTCQACRIYRISEAEYVSKNGLVKQKRERERETDRVCTMCTYSCIYIYTALYIMQLQAHTCMHVYIYTLQTHAHVYTHSLYASASKIRGSSCRVTGTSLVRTAGTTLAWVRTTCKEPPLLWTLATSGRCQHRLPNTPQP